MQEVAEKLKNWKDAAIRKKMLKNNKDWNNFLRSMIRNHEQWVYSSTILTHWAVMTYVPHQVLPQVQESQAGKWECCEIHERIWVFLETFLIVNMLNEILINYTIIREIWRHHWRFWKTEGIENNGSEEPLQSRPSPCFTVRARRKSPDDK